MKTKTGKNNELQQIKLCKEIDETVGHLSASAIKSTKRSEKDVFTIKKL